MTQVIINYKRKDIPGRIMLFKSAEKAQEWFNEKVEALSSVAPSVKKRTGYYYEDNLGTMEIVEVFDTTD